MPTPVQTQILDLILARLEGITTANEYFTEVKKIERSRLQPFKNGDWPAITYYGSGDVLSKKIHCGVSERIQSVIIEYYDKTRDRVFTDLSNELASDVLITLDRDPAAPLVSDTESLNLGGVVVNVDVESITPVIGEGQAPYCGAVIVLNVTYKVSKQDPFTLIN